MRDSAVIKAQTNYFFENDSLIIRRFDSSFGSFSTLNDFFEYIIYKVRRLFFFFNHWKSSHKMYIFFSFFFTENSSKKELKRPAIKE